MITPVDFQNIDLRGLSVHYHDGYCSIDLPEVTIEIEKRPYYCDRGRYGFWVANKNHTDPVVDFADRFPRYFFNLQRGIDEIIDWIEIRKLMPT